MFKLKGINKKPTCQNMYQGVTLAGREREIEKEWAVHHFRKMQKKF